jgi:hypothetical protein
VLIQSISRWEFQSEGHDIKFGVICQDIDGTESTIVPVHKVNSHHSNEIGVITCPTPATCKYSHSHTGDGWLQSLNQMMFIIRIFIGI